MVRSWSSSSKKVPLQRPHWEVAVVREEPPGSSGPKTGTTCSCVVPHGVSRPRAGLEGCTSRLPRQEEPPGSPARASGVTFPKTRGRGVSKLLADWAGAANSDS
eukprot:5570866-Amphidinium_carterae.1